MLKTKNVVAGRTNDSFILYLMKYDLGFIVVVLSKVCIDWLWWCRESFTLMRLFLFA